MKSVLLIDDEVFARDHLARLIEKKGFRVYTASSGEEGINSFRENRPDHVFLDVLLPGIEGEEVLRYIREIDPEASVYFITGCSDILTVERAVQLGAKGYLTKPIFVEDIFKLLNEFSAEKETTLQQ